jgi:hypothetical protein
MSGPGTWVSANVEDADTRIALLRNMVDPSKWNGEIPPTSSVQITTVQVATIYGVWTAQSNPGAPISGLSGVLVWQPNRAWDGLTRCGIWPANTNIQVGVNTPSYKTGPNSLLVPFPNSLQASSGDTGITISPRLEEQFTMGRLLYGQFLILSDTTALNATTFGGNLCTATIPDSRDALTPKSDNPGAGSLSATSLIATSTPKKDGNLSVEIQDGIVGVFGSDITMDMKPLVSNAKMTANLRGSDASAQDRMKITKTGHIPIVRPGTHAFIECETVVAGRNGNMEYPLADHWYSAWNIDTNHGPFLNTNPGYENCSNEKYTFPDTPLFAVTDVELELYADVGKLMGAQWNADSTFSFANSGAAPAAYVYATGSPFPANQYPVQDVYVRVTCQDIFVQMSSTTPGMPEFRQKQSKTYLWHILTSDRSPPPHTSTVMPTLVPVGLDIVPSFTHANASEKARFVVNHRPIVPDDNFAPYVHLGTHVTFSLLCKKAVPQDAPAQSIPASSLYTCTFNNDFLSYCLTTAVPEMYKKGNLDMRIVKWESVSEGQNIKVKGNLVVECVAGAEITQYIGTSIAQHTTSSSQQDVWYLAGLLFNGDSPMFKRFYPGPEYKRLKYDILPTLTLDNILSHPGVSDAAANAVSASGLFGNLLGGLGAMGGNMIAQGGRMLGGMGDELVGTLMSGIPGMASGRYDDDDDFADARGTYGDARGTYGDARGTYGDARGTYGDARGTYGDARGTYGDARAHFRKRHRY